MAHTVVVNELEGVRGEAMHVARTTPKGKPRCYFNQDATNIGRPAVREQNSHLMNRLGHKRQEIPECIGILQVGLWVALLGMDEVLGTTMCVVANHVPVPLLRIKLDGKSPGIPRGIRAALLTADSRESGENGRALADLAQEVCAGVLADVVGNLCDSSKSVDLIMVLRVAFGDGHDCGLFLPK
ncbi:hypothetical protein BC938DRAFT_482892 [Jimgerdemannia flammicorona]|uniref:Uncharacterized protein n=1 Tax=Jimgerdemannia flammicorona TaxID=994334 RepID=A0A433QW12_9FUNG|nr:hypothetical protein BC938DRAFT_482892 [Jimgerdemannia flammicorona]